MIAWIDNLAGDPAAGWYALAHLADHAAAVFGGVQESRRGSRDQRARARALATLAWAQLDFGDWKRAEETAHRALCTTAATGQIHAHARATAALAFLHGQRGDEPRFKELVAAVERVAVPNRLRDLLADAQLIRGQIALAVGDQEAALAHLLRLFDPGDPAGDPTRARAACFDLVEAAILAHADVSDALLRVDAVLGRARTSPEGRVLNRAIDALVAADAEVDVAVEVALATAADASPMVRARLNLSLGRRMRRQRRMIASRIPLASAIETFSALGATAWGARAQHELRATGSRSGEQRAGGRDSLTEQEREIARLAAQGLSNRQIGEQLYLSPRTIGSHLYRAYPKLGVTSRMQLRDALAA